MMRPPHDEKSLLKKWGPHLLFLKCRMKGLIVAGSRPGIGMNDDNQLLLNMYMEVIILNIPHFNVIRLMEDILHQFQILSPP